LTLTDSRTKAMAVELHERRVRAACRRARRLPLILGS
jgi:hypothetical protein